MNKVLSIVKELLIGLYEFLEDWANSFRLDAMVRCMIIVLMLYQMSTLGALDKMPKYVVIILDIMLILWAMSPVFKVVRELFTSDKKKRRKNGSNFTR